MDFLFNFRRVFFLDFLALMGVFLKKKTVWFGLLPFFFFPHFFFFFFPPQTTRGGGGNFFFFFIFFFFRCFPRIFF